MSGEARCHNECSGISSHCSLWKQASILFIEPVDTCLVTLNLWLLGVQRTHFLRRWRVAFPHSLPRYLSNKWINLWKEGNKERGREGRRERERIPLPIIETNIKTQALFPMEESSWQLWFCLDWVLGRVPPNGFWQLHRLNIQSLISGLDQWYVRMDLCLLELQPNWPVPPASLVLLSCCAECKLLFNLCFLISVIWISVA